MIDTHELFVGDIVRLEPGDQIACDGVLIEGYGTYIKRGHY